MNQTVNSFVICKWCSMKLVDPVVLPCGKTICSSHQVKFKRGKDNKKKAVCKLCDKEHRLSINESFPVNDVVLNLLCSRIEKLNFNDLDSYKSAEEKFRDLSELKEQFDRNKGNPDEFVFKYFSSVRNQIDLKREELIQEIHKFCLRLVEEVNAREKECSENLKHIDMQEVPEFVKKLEKDLIQWDASLKQLIVDESTWKMTSAKATEYIAQLKVELKEQEERMILGRDKKYAFETKFMNLHDLFCTALDFNT